MEYWEIQSLLETMGIILVVLIPVTGLTLRFAVKPFLRDYMAMKEGRGGEPDPDQRRRLARMEEQLEDLESSVRRLAEAAEFDRQLGRVQGEGRGEGGGGGGRPEPR